MKGKLAVLLGFGAGYVFGTRAGHDRYEQIKGQAQRMWQDPRVQQRKDQATHVLKEQGGHAKDRIQDRVHHDTTASTPPSDWSS